jgi:hypothetical protein
LPQPATLNLLPAAMEHSQIKHYYHKGKKGKNTKYKIKLEDFLTPPRNSNLKDSSAGLISGSSTF